MKAHAIDEKTTPLAEIDAKIARTRFGGLTLDPNRSIATPLTELVPSLADSRQAPHLAATALAVAEAQLEAFPENLFWDFDFYLASIHSRAASLGDYAGELQAVTAVTVDLMRIYGQQSVIRFRYVHDFMYGFDWARWVRRDPETRASVKPFDIEFLRQSERRGHDIQALIEADDRWYPQLSDGAVRNPFPFSREPEQELRLYRLLADRNAIPVQAWRVDAAPDAGRDFDELREDVANLLGLSR